MAAAHKAPLPFLPGHSIQTHTPYTFKKSHMFDIHSGVPVKDAIEHRVFDVPINKSIKVAKVNEIVYDHDHRFRKLPQRDPTAIPMSILPAWIAFNNKVLRFSCYFKEPVSESAQESSRVRDCELLFYLEDESIQVEEVKDINSGMKQGLLIRRHQVPKDSAHFYSINDLRIGAEVCLYGKVFYLFGADTFTKKFFSEKLNIELEENQILPVDEFHQKRIDMTRVRSTFAKQASEITEFNECQLGKPMRSQLRRVRRFLEHDRKVLRFWAIWRDPAMSGEIRPFIVHFFLCDGTMEVLEVKQPNSGRDAFPALLSRQKLPRVFEASNQALIGHGNSDDIAFYTEADIRIGSNIEVLTRDLLITDADPFTRKFYKREYGLSDADMQSVHLEDEDMFHKDKDGSDKQHNKSPTNSTSKQSSKQASTFVAKERAQLRFEAVLNTMRPEDKDRRFIVTYFLYDSSVSIFEKKIRNSGFVGGKFLERIRLRNPDNKREWFSPQDFFIGALLSLNRYRLRLVDADELTLRFMEGHKEFFPTADADLVARKLGELLKQRNTSLRKTFRSVDTDHDNTIDLDEFVQLVKLYGWDLSEQECLSVFRKWDKSHRGYILFNEFIDEISNTVNN